MARSNKQKGKCTCGGTIKGKAKLSEQEARHDAAAYNTVPDGRRPMNAYYCDYCQYWHIGHARNEEKSA